uniref:Major facilitator superfamily (MFS) profile domain-containing protein n=1 Tax=Amphimedon queenslandica TaxID=400682 RepID=A0A1X7VVZ1_AMPQE
MLTTAFPIFCEAVVEQTYPIAEGTSTGLLILALHTGTLIFAIIGISGVFSDKHPERARAMSWVATGAIFLALLLVVFYSEDHRRLKVDKKGKQEENHKYLPIN